MALPTTPPIDFAQNQHICPPFKSAGGAFYAIGLVEGDLTQIAAYKTSDPETDGDWTVQDAAGQPDVGAEDILALAAVQDGDVIHIVTQNAGRASGMSTFHDVDYHQFNMATDNWDVAAETVDNAQEATEASVAIAVRSDGDVVVCYMGTVQGNMGSDWARADYDVRTSGTWAGPLAMGAPSAANIHQRIDSCVLGASDRVHFFLSEYDGTSTFANAHQSLSNADALDTLTRYEGPSTSARFGHGTPAYDGTDVRVPLQLTSGTLGGIVKFASAANPTITQEAAHDNEIHTGPAGATSAMGTAQGVYLFRGNPNDDRYLLYLDATGRDLYSDESLGGDGAWGTDVLEDSSGVIGFMLSATIYTRGADEVIAFLWEEGDASVEYNEIVLPALAGIPNLHMAPLQPT